MRADWARSCGYGSRTRRGLCGLKLRARERCGRAREQRAGERQYHALDDALYHAKNIMRRKIERIAVCVAAVMLLVAGAGARPKDKVRTPKRDPLADYVQRVSGPAPVAAATTAGSLGVDNGRLANMVADYKASRVGDLVTISIAQNLSSTSTGNVATSRNFSASSGITALPGKLKTAGGANFFHPPPG